MKKNLRAIVIVTIVILVPMSFTWVQNHGWHRPYINWDIKELATHLAENNRSPRGCLDLVWYQIGQQEGEARAECVYDYAKLTKDPSACELLMPSSYGLSCVGGAENSEMPCNTNVKPYAVYWRDGEKENTVDIHECLSDGVKRTELGQQCCMVARVAYLKNDNDCSPLKKNPIVYDRCLYSLAWKLKEPSYCNEITNENAKAACKVQTKAIKDDPSFCPGCITPLESIDQLK